MTGISIFTDGSCNPMLGIGAWASIILSDTKTVLTGVSANTTNQRMELTSVIGGLRFLLENFDTKIQVTVFTDSQYVAGLGARRERLESRNFQTAKNEGLSNSDLLKELFQYMDQLDVSFVKVKAHRNKSFEENMNREADRLCRKVMRRAVVQINPPSGK